MGNLDVDVLKLMKTYYDKIKASYYGVREYESHAFSKYYRECNDEIKVKAKRMFGVKNIKAILDVADEYDYNLIESSCEKLNSFDVPDKSWDLYCYFIVNNFNESSEKIKDKIIDKYGKKFISCMIDYEKEHSKRVAECRKVEYAKNVPFSIEPIMPVLDDYIGILFYSEEKKQLYIFDRLFSTDMMGICNKNNILKKGNCLSWKEERYIFEYESNFVTVEYDKFLDALYLSTNRSVNVEARDCDGAYEVVRTDNFRGRKEINDVRTKLQVFDKKFIDRKSVEIDFSKTIEYLKNVLNIDFV